jgi:hypothetical protein
MDALGCHSFTEQIIDGASFRYQQHIGNGIGDQTVDLFRHRPIEAPQASFRVNNVDTHFLGDESPCDGGIHIADYDDSARGSIQKHGLQTLHYFGRLLGVAASPGA